MINFWQNSWWTTKTDGSKGTATGSLSPSIYLSLYIYVYADHLILLFVKFYKA